MYIYIYILYIYIYIYIYSYPYPCPKRVLQTSYCTHFLYGYVLQTVLGTGMGMNVTAQDARFKNGRAPPRRPELE